jgi:hypothetical protein
LVSDQGLDARQIQVAQRPIAHAHKNTGEHDMLPVDALLKVSLLIFRGSSDCLSS